MTVDRLDVSDLDSRRRALAAGIMKRLSDRAIRAPEDGTVTWIAPVLSDNGWSVQHLSRDLYAGSHGVALLLAGYLREQRAGRADPVPGLEELWHGLLLTIRKIEDRGDKQRREGMVLRPEPPGAYLGLGSQIWSWLLQESFGVDDALERAVALARLMPEAVKADDSHDLLLGMAGAIPSLLRLASRTGEHSWVEIAADAGHRLAKAALLDARGARWPGPRWPDGIGGFAHGATGIGWALGTLAAATGEDLFARLATEAHAFEESAYDPVAKGWRDLRDPVRTASAWCHGSVGIGVSTQDNEVRKRASEATWADGLGWNHTLCHGDTGSWELLSSCKPDGVEQSTLDAYVIGSLEQHGPISGLARDTFSPGLLPGLGGVAYQLLRMHPGCDLPSVLLP
jgi:lantibiotic modifying enzyme